MLWRVRATLPDRPGVLAGLATACGWANGNIVAVHVFREEGTVTDELVIDLPAGAGPATIAEIVADADGTLVSAAQCSPAAAEDQPTRYVRAAQRIIERPMAFPEIAAELFDAGISVEGIAADVLEMVVGGVATVQIRRAIPFTSVERARAMALADLVGQVLDARTVPTPRATLAATPDYVAEGDTVSALAGGHVAGRATLTVTEAGPWPVDIWVDAGWQRRGIGTRLLSDIARAARSQGAGEIVLVAPAHSSAVLPMVIAAGMRGRIRVTDANLTVRISLADIRSALSPSA
jgi:GNAT superfamily N-acetyltransferase